MNQKGVSLVELMVVIVVSSIIGIAMINLFSTSNRTYLDQTKVLDAQRDGRLIMEYIARALREAGLDPIGAAGAGIEEATATKVRLTRDTNMSGAIDGGTAERISFEFDNGRGILRRGVDETQPGETWIDMVENVNSFSLQYLDIDDTDIGVPDTAAKRASIRSIVMAITFQDSKYMGGDFTRSFTTRIRLRNR